MSNQPYQQSPASGAPPPPQGYSQPPPPPPQQAYGQQPQQYQPIPPPKAGNSKNTIMIVGAVIVVAVVIIAAISMIFLSSVPDDLDGDGYEDVIDAFPLDPFEWLDSDNDGYGDNSDIFPLDSTEWSDYDNDGIGDQSDYTEIHFEWEYQPTTNFSSSTWTWNPQIGHSFYMAYKNYDVAERNEFGKMITTSDPQIEAIVESLKTTIADENYDNYDAPSFVLAFVQSIEYVHDNVSTGYDQYSQFPVETLFEQDGDCEDTAILYATLMKGLGYDVCMLNPPGHMAVGIAGEAGLPGTYISYGGINYYYCETTGEGWAIGALPPAYEDAQFEVVEITGEQWVPDY